MTFLRPTYMIWPKKELKSLRKKLIDADINHLEGFKKKNHDEDLNNIKESHEILP